MRFITIAMLALVMTGCGYSSRNYSNSGGTGTAATPSVASLSPNKVPAGSSAFTLTVNGSNFSSGAIVYFNGAAQATMFVSANQLAAAITAAEVASSGTMPVYVHSGIYNSNTVDFSVQ